MNLRYSGLEGFRVALQELGEPLQGTTGNQAHVKVVRVSLEGAVARTRALIETSGNSEQGCIQQHASWDCTWRRTGSGPEGLHLVSLVASDYEEVVRQGPVWFADCTRSVLGANPVLRTSLGMA